MNSTGSSDSAGAWREELAGMVENGNRKGAIDTEIGETTHRFGDKYDVALTQMLDVGMKRGDYPENTTPEQRRVDELKDE